MDRLHKLGYVLVLSLVAALTDCQSTTTPSAPAPASANASAALPTSNAQPITAKAPATSCLGIVDGAQVSSTTYPAVVNLMRLQPGLINFCTGTFISSSAVLTAGHCVSSGSNTIYLISGNPPAGTTVSAAAVLSAVKILATASSVVTTGFTAESAQTNPINSSDVAIVLFPAGTAPAVMPLATTRPAVGATVTMVGYGDDVTLDQTPQDAFAKRTGTNVVINPVSGDRYASDPTVLEVGGQTLAAAQAANGTIAFAADNDMGGPLITGAQSGNGGALAASLTGAEIITDSTTGVAHYISDYIDVNSPQTQQLIAKANVAGAAIGATATNNSVVPSATTCQ